MHHLMIYAADQAMPLSFSQPSLSSTWPHLNSDVGLEEGEYYQNCLCAIVLCSISAMYLGLRILETDKKLDQEMR